MNSSKPPVDGVRSAMRSTALTTPPWQHTTIVRPGWAATASRTAWPTRWCSSATVSPPGNVTACGSDSQSGMPWRSMNSSNVSPSQSGPGVVLAPAVVDEDVGAAERRRRSGPPSPAPAGSRWRRARRRRARRSRRGGRRGGRTGRGRGRTARRTSAGRRSPGSTLAVDSPWRTSTSRVTGKPGRRRSHGHGSDDRAAPRCGRSPPAGRSAHRVRGATRDRSARPSPRTRVARPGGPSRVPELFVQTLRVAARGPRVGPVAPGPRPKHRFTVRSRDADPRAAAIDAGAASLGLPLDGAVGVADVVFVEGDLDAAARDALGAFLADPAAADRHVGRPRRRRQSRSRCTPA